jgi:hypothetical protein
MLEEKTLFEYSIEHDWKLDFLDKLFIIKSAIPGVKYKYTAEFEVLPDRDAIYIWNCKADPIL